MFKVFVSDKESIFWFALVPRESVNETCFLCKEYSKNNPKFEFMVYNLCNSSQKNPIDQWYTFWGFRFPGFPCFLAQIVVIMINFFEFQGIRDLDQDSFIFYFVLPNCKSLSELTEK